MRNAMRKLIAAVGVAAAVITPIALEHTAAAAGPQPAPRVTYNSATDCSQSAWLGARVCFDDTTGYGPVGYVFTSGTTVYAAEGSTIGCSANAIGAFIGTPYEASVSSTGTDLAGMSTFQHFPVPCSGTFFTFSPGFHDIIEWVVACRCGYEYVHVN